MENKQSWIAFGSYAKKKRSIEIEFMHKQFEDATKKLKTELG